jgi:hypothetical protein
MTSIRTIVLFIAGCALSLTAANLKLYTTDGDYQLVREYKVEGDLVKFYSVDRSEWEEVPASMVDLKRTETESSATRQVVDRQAKMAHDEIAAALADREEIAKIPKDSGVYRIENGLLRTFPVADFTVHTPKGNTALRVLTPIPIVAGKATVELSGEHSPNIVREDRPEFFFQLDKEESFGIIKLSKAKGVRIAEHVEIMPISKEMAEDRDSVKVFSRQLTGENFYKVWPEEALPAGEYALIEYVDGQVDLRLWDFRIE